MPDCFSFDVFLSHNSEDKTRVRRLAELLRAKGLRVWFDEWVIRPGDDIYLAIERGLGAARTLVLCLSSAALKSDWVGLERSTALFRETRCWIICVSFRDRHTPRKGRWCSASSATASFFLAM